MEIKNEIPVIEQEMVTIPKSEYKSLLGKELVYPIGTKLCKKILHDTGIENIIITDHVTDADGHLIYRMKMLGWYDGSHISEESQEYFQTEFGLSSYTPVVEFMKLEPV